MIEILINLYLKYKLKCKDNSESFINKKYDHNILLISNKILKKSAKYVAILCNI